MVPRDPTCKRIFMGNSDKLKSENRCRNLNVHVSYSLNSLMGLGFKV